LVILPALSQAELWQQHISYKNTKTNSLLDKSNYYAAWQMEGEQVTCVFSVNLSPGFCNKSFGNKSFVIKRKQ